MNKTSTQQDYQTQLTLELICNDNQLNTIFEDLAKMKLEYPERGLICTNFTEYLIQKLATVYQVRFSESMNVDHKQTRDTHCFGVVGTTFFKFAKVSIDIWITEVDWRKIAEHYLSPFEDLITALDNVNYAIGSLEQFYNHFLADQDAQEYDYWFQVHKINFGLSFMGGDFQYSTDHRIWASYGTFDDKETRPDFYGLVIDHFNEIIENYFNQN